MVKKRLESHTQGDEASKDHPYIFDSSKYLALYLKKEVKEKKNCTCGNIHVKRSGPLEGKVTK